MDKRYYQNDSTLVSRLADQAHGKSLEIYDMQTATERADQVIFYDIFNQEFANLIIQECVQVSLKNSHCHDDMGAIIAINIKQHFGDKS